jgi:hypothetical protein
MQLPPIVPGNLQESPPHDSLQQCLRTDDDFLGANLNILLYSFSIFPACKMQLHTRHSGGSVYGPCSKATPGSQPRELSGLHQATLHAGDDDCAPNLRPLLEVNSTAPLRQKRPGMAAHV